MADPREITATLVVNFGEGAENLNDGLVAEIDSRPDGLNNGKTRFSPGDEVYILLFASSNVVLNAPVVSAGNLAYRPSLSPQVIDFEQDLQFVDDVEARLTYPLLPDRSFTGRWLGYSLGNVTKRGEMVLGIPQPMDGGEPREHWAGLYRVNYPAVARVYHLTNTLLTEGGQPIPEYSIIVHFSGIAQ